MEALATPMHLAEQKSDSSHEVVIAKRDPWWHMIGLPVPDAFHLESPVGLVDAVEAAPCCPGADLCQCAQNDFQVDVPSCSHVIHHDISPAQTGGVSCGLYPSGTASSTASAGTADTAAAAVEALNCARWFGLQTRLSLPGAAIDLSTILALDDRVSASEICYAQLGAAEYPVVTVPAVPVATSLRLGRVPGPWLAQMHLATLLLQ